MANPKRSASAPDQGGAQEQNQAPTQVQSVVSLATMIAEAIVSARTAPVHGGLIALEMALVELKLRAASVQDQLAADHAPILDRIKEL